MNKYLFFCGGKFLGKSDYPLPRGNKIKKRQSKILKFIEFYSVVGKKILARCPHHHRRKESEEFWFRKFSEFFYSVVVGEKILAWGPHHHRNKKSEEFWFRKFSEFFILWWWGTPTDKHVTHHKLSKS